MEGIQARVADMIFQRGAFKFGAFKLKLHEKKPDAPLSPFYLNLRTPDNPKPGPLTPHDCELIARALWQVVLEKQLRFQAIAGIPNAADPIVEALQNILPGSIYRFIRLAKQTDGDKRRIIPLPGFDYRRGETVLLIDDLVTKADSKLEAIRAIEESGSKVKDLVVLVDREQGGSEELSKAGYSLTAVFGITALFSHYYLNNLVSETKYIECLDYLKNN